MNVFVTGATGFVGRAILRQLHAAGHSARILVRNPERSRLRTLLADPRTETHRGNVLDFPTLQGALAGMDAVIHLVGIISETGRQTYERVHTQGTENVVRAAQEEGVVRFLQMSALGTRPNAVARYHRSKWAAEELVRQSGLDWTIFRPSIIYGPGDAFVNLFAKIARWSPVVPVMGSGQSRFQPISVEDVAAYFVRALTESRALRQTFDLCGLDVFTLEDILDVILETLGRRRVKVHVPPGLARFQAGMLEFIFPILLRRAPPLNRDQLLMLEEDNVGNPEWAMALLGGVPRPFREGMRMSLKRET